MDEWAVPVEKCSNDILPNISLGEVLDQYSDTTMEIVEDWVIEAYVISSDQEGNIFNTLHLQDKPVNPTAGLQLELELRDSYLFFQPGDKVLISLKGLYLGKSKGLFKLGSAFSTFGTLQPGRLPKHRIFTHIAKSCDQPFSLQPQIISIDEVPFQPLNTLVRIEEMEFAEEELDSSYAQENEQTLRKLIDCQDNEIRLLNSGYSDFYAETLPAGMGSITAINYTENGEPTLIIRSVDDIHFTQDRCEEWITEFTSKHLFISELADPDNNSSARFVELYYSGDEPLPLKGWHLDRYTNDNADKSSSVDLSDFVVDPGQFLVIASNAEVFEQTYGFAPDIEGGSNSPADSNGDDNLTLVDPFGKLVDIFGVIGEDGSGTSHEFEDGRAYRKTGVSLANPVFTSQEWVVYNDTGASGTINQPQNAPGDFSPGLPN
ncbi:DUF5689 domain-containing protein [Muriicola sp. SD30]|uniref:DUF5689 domain-containing protein n=1 Tax=Muriicola sp. SD30 TaxID=3240936 RepID=UPI003510750D